MKKEITLLFFLFTLLFSLKGMAHNEDCSQYTLLGDLHGNMHALVDVLKQEEFLSPEGEIKAFKGNCLVISGDIIDRGYYSRSLLGFLFHLQDVLGKEHVILVLGNHEAYVLKYDIKKMTDPIKKRLLGNIGIGPWVAKEELLHEFLTKLNNYCTYFLSSDSLNENPSFFYNKEEEVLKEFYINKSGEKVLRNLGQISPEELQSLNEPQKTYFDFSSLKEKSLCVSLKPEERKALHASLLKFNIDSHILKEENLERDFSQIHIFTPLNPEISFSSVYCDIYTDIFTKDLSLIQEAPYILFQKKIKEAIQEKRFVLAYDIYMGVKKFIVTHAGISDEVLKHLDLPPSPYMVEYAKEIVSQLNQRLLDHIETLNDDPVINSVLWYRLYDPPAPPHPEETLSSSFSQIRGHDIVYDSSESTLMNGNNEIFQLDSGASYYYANQRRYMSIKIKENLVQVREDSAIEKASDLPPLILKKISSMML